MTVLNFSASEFRSLPIPGHPHAKLASFFARAADIPPELREWMEVNPRIPKVDRAERLNTPVGKAMVRTLKEEPQLFVLKNQGMWILSQKVSFAKGDRGEGTVEVKLVDRESHGLVNGGHTFAAITQVSNEMDSTDDWDAYVRVHILEGVDPDFVDDLAEGLNRSLQVDQPSLENLRGSFDEIEEHMKGKRGANEIAYHQGHKGNVDILDVLTLMAIFDLDRFPNHKTHPHPLFGHPKAVLKHFLEKNSTFDIILPQLHEILVLSEKLQQAALDTQAIRIGQVKISESDGKTRVGSKAHKNRPCYFADGKIDGYIPWGWLLPMMSGFRAAVDQTAWKKKRKFVWIKDPNDLLPTVVDELADVTYRVHIDNKKKPADVGRKEAAYRLAYSAVMMELVSAGLVGKGT